MTERMLQLVLQYDGGAFSGWQRQPATRTVQGVLEDALARLCGSPVSVLGAGRTDAGVHARGQAAGVRVAERWTAPELRRAMNAVLPDDVWVADALEMVPEFHARFSATRRRYSYHVGLDEAAASPFRVRYELAFRRALDAGVLATLAGELRGAHCFRAFAVRGTAPADDDHRCDVAEASWETNAERLVFHVEANRFLHHMVRFLVGTMLDIASGRREASLLGRLLRSDSNRDVSAPAPPHALFLERVSYPAHLYLGPA